VKELLLNFRPLFSSTGRLFGRRRERFCGRFRISRIRGTIIARRSWILFDCPILEGKLVREVNLLLLFSSCDSCDERDKKLIIQKEQDGYIDQIRS
jgi:hypothetical protein